MDSILGAVAALDAGPRPARMSGRRILAGLVGRAIQASRTPSMHEAEGRRLSLDYTYRLLDFDALHLPDAALPDVIAAARRAGYAGLNVTHPFKERVADRLDGLSAEAAAIGSVNTVVMRDGVAIGHNTDGWGFRESFRRDMAGAPAGEAVLIGAGGAGAAVAWALLDCGVERLGVHDVDAGKAAALAASLAAAFGPTRARAADDLRAALAAADGVVNATPVGMAKYPGTPCPSDWLRRDLWVADIVYFPRETELLRAARALGCRTLAGTGMAVFQAVKAFELITGVAPDARQMESHFDSA